MTIRFELDGYTIYMDDTRIGDLDINIPGDGKPYIIFAPVNLNSTQLRGLAEYLDQPAILEHARKLVPAEMFGDG